MKKQLLSMAGLLLINVSIAQTQKGNGILSGSVSANYGRYKTPVYNVDLNQTATSTDQNWASSLQITAGRFWSDNWMAGLSVNGSASFGQSSVNYRPFLEYSGRNVSVTTTPFIRRYWQVNSIYVFAGAGLSVGLIDNRQPVFDTYGKVLQKDGQRSASVFVNPRIELGANYFLTKRLALQLLTTASSVPLTTGNFYTGLVYWTGPDRKASPQEERANAQTDKGRWVLEGSFSGYKQKNTQTENAVGGGSQFVNNIYSLSPSIGFFVGKNNLLGISIPILYQTSKRNESYPASNPEDVWTIGLSPYFQHYWASSRLTPYTRASIGYTSNQLLSKGADEFNGGVAIGLAYMVGQRFIIETSLVNASVSYLLLGNNSDDSKGWNANVTAGLGGSFAVRYVFQ